MTRSLQNCSWLDLAKVYVFVQISYKDLQHLLVQTRSIHPYWRNLRNNNSLIFFLSLQFFLCSFFFCVFTLMLSFLQFYKFQCKSFQTLLYFYVLLGLRISIRTSLVCHNPMLMFYLSHIVNLLDQVNSQWCVFVMITLYITQSALETVGKLYGEICVMMCGCRVVRKMQKTQVGMMN